MLSLPPLNSASWCDDQKCSWTFNTWSVSLDCVWPLTSRKPMFSFNGWMLSSGCLICGASKDQWMSNFCCLVVVTIKCKLTLQSTMYNGPSIKFLIHLFEWQLFHEWRTCQLNHWLACFIHLRFVCMNHSYLLNFFATNNISHNGSSRLLGNTGELEFHTRGWPRPACRRSGFICLNLFWLHDFERIKKPFRRYDFQFLCHYSMLMSPRTEVVVVLDKNTALFIFSIGCLWESCCI